ncbi:helix-turn-helix transcriptional regulator [Pandoraea cepalis]|uniref:helix-turn-helix transcriptional regulator n=1 Tax=Pandoraea cepalis TaxID=2508294 RepID=UPI0020C381BB|nr:helix-turn-helix domain-containing protein [Pandoraea cepalis]
MLRKPRIDGPKFTDDQAVSCRLAARWDISEATLERWRSEGIGPKFLKLQGRVLYRQSDIEAYEESCLRISTSAKVLTS